MCTNLKYFFQCHKRLHENLMFLKQEVGALVANLGSIKKPAPQEGSAGSLTNII